MIRRFALVFVVVAVAGCDPLRTNLPAVPAVPDVALPAAPLDPAACGDVAGGLAWVGPSIPTEPIRVPRTGADGVSWLTVANPNGFTGAGVAVWLEGVAVSRPWDLPAVSVIAGDVAIQVQQGDAPPGRVGFVRRGDVVTMRSTTEKLVGVRGRGADFFTRLLPDSREGTRVFSRPGRVELTSPAAVAWAVADLYVCEHPYYAATNSRSEFRLPQVPAGAYTLCYRVPDPRIVGHDRDPENGVISRQRYGPAAELRVPVTVTAGISTGVRLEIRAGDFPGKSPLFRPGNAAQ